MKNHIFASACALSVLFGGLGASASVIYNEGTTGADLPPSGAASYYDFGALSAGIDRVKGSVGGRDLRDAFSFTLDGTATIDLGWRRPSQTRPVATLYDSSFNLLGRHSLGSDIFGTLEAGDYFIVISSRNRAKLSSYRMSFDVTAQSEPGISPVPLPASGLLLLAGLGGLAAQRRRKRG